MNYIIYKTTFLQTGKFYIGMHQTENIDDGYLGSGKLLARAIKKHGVEKFKREVLFVFGNEQEMRNKEAELVTTELIASGKTYNLCEGGKGGFGHINRAGLAVRNLTDAKVQAKAAKNSKKFRAQFTPEQKREWAARMTKNGNGMQGKRHSEETKQKMRGPRGPNPKLSKAQLGKKRGPYKKQNSPSAIRKATPSGPEHIVRVRIPRG